MRVAHREEIDTHAIVGGNNVEEFGISQTAEFFTVLSDTLYSNKPLAVVREVLCNAWDAHIVSGRTDRPIIVGTKDDMLSIRDFGTGIPHDMIHKIYCIYGSSTKENDGMQTGGFGLGSKSPFAYNEHFTVDNHHDGLRTVHAISRGSAQTKGKPDRRVMVSVPTTETGIEVSIPIKNTTDRKTFERLVSEIASYGEMNVILNGVQIVKTEISSAENNAYITNSDYIPNTNGRNIVIRYGNVLYPIESHDDIVFNYDRITKALKSIADNNGKHYANDSWKIIIQAPPHSISVTPSRESVSMSETTVNTLNKLFDEVYPFINPKGELIINAINNQEDKSIDYIISEGKLDILAYSKNIYQDAYKDLNIDAYGDVLKNVDSIAAYMLSINNRRSFSPYPEQKKRAQKLIDNNYRRVHVLKKFMKARACIKSCGGKHVIEKHFTYNELFHDEKERLLKNLYKADIVNPNNLHVVISANSYDSRRGFIQYKKFYISEESLLSSLTATIIITHSKSSFNDEFFSWDEGKKAITKEQDRIVYLAPRTKGHKEAAISFFEKYGYRVLDFASWHDEQIAELEKRTTDLKKEYNILPTTPAIPVPAKAKSKGLPLLIDNMFEGRFINKRHLTDESLMKRSENFTHIVKPYNILDNFFPWATSTGMVKHFSKDIAIVVNTKQQEKYLKEGKKDGLELMVQRLSDAILNSPRIRNYYELASVSNEYYHYGIPGQIKKLIDISKHSSIINKLINVPEMPTEIEMEYINIYSNSFGRAYSNRTKPWEIIIGKLHDEIKSYTKPAYFEPLKHRILDRKDYLDSLDLDDIANVFATKGSKLSIQRRVFMESLIINALG